MALIRVISPGLFTTVQDLGRPGVLRLGIPPSGAMDQMSLFVANLLLGNNPGAACLEITLLGPHLEFEKEARVAITGADLQPRLDGSPVEMWSTLRIKAGDRLGFSSAISGCRSYLAVAGGFDAPEVLGSKSTYVRASLGGFRGRPLRAGDELDCVTRNAPTASRRLPSRYRPDIVGDVTARIIWGPQNSAFKQEALDLLVTCEFTVNAKSDRMGYRLDGPRLPLAGSPDIVSDGVPAGAIQTPGQGTPIVMMADRQTTGGYPKIATVISSDLDRVGQLKPGDRMRFSAVSVERAHALYLERIAMLDRIRTHLANSA